ncbi:hypothetical protein FTO74_06645 [Granulicella sp. WH15]|uniref:hypothetical protein n=1 Tax=Granulicella sp. WH15 TaxID=2602070 RepID=UPI001366C8E8|nr:hypothetical protein [Granulicella sp. WH15]QHN03083.1 hypothetical protein FTO74_06645 [Granulicella sp. WH15]
MIGPTLVALAFAGVAHAQGTMDFSGAQTLMTTFNPRFAYVSVSRASHDAQLFTNDAATLAESLSHNVSKASAVDFNKVQSPVASVGQERTPTSRPKLSEGLGLAL